LKSKSGWDDLKGKSLCRHVFSGPSGVFRPKIFKKGKKVEVWQECWIISCGFVRKRYGFDV